MLDVEVETGKCGSPPDLKQFAIKLWSPDSGAKIVKDSAEKAGMDSTTAVIKSYDVCACDRDACNDENLMSSMASNSPSNDQSSSYSPPKQSHSPPTPSDAPANTPLSKVPSTTPDKSLPGSPTVTPKPSVSTGLERTSIFVLLTTLVLVSLSHDFVR